MAALDFRLVFWSEKRRQTATPIINDDKTYTFISLHVLSPTRLLNMNVGHAISFPKVQKRLELHPFAETRLSGVQFEVASPVGCLQCNGISFIGRIS